jgi:hypothetical protein
VRTLTKSAFFDDLVSVTRHRPATRYLYLMLEENGGIAVQWEQPNGDHRVQYRVTDACPHCIVIEAASHLAPILPLDLIRAARARVHYETVLATGSLPHLAFARQSEDPGVTWLGDSHAEKGNPHSAADCADHRSAEPVDADPGWLTEVLLQFYPSMVAAEEDIDDRLLILKRFVDGAEEVAGDRAEFAAAIAFLRKHATLGLPVPDSDGAVIAVRKSATSPRTSAIMRMAPGVPYQDGLCLVPDPELEPRLPFYMGSMDLTGAAPMRTIRLPVKNKDRLSHLGAGIMLLYQTRYAMNVHRVPGEVRPPNHWANVAALHVFEFDMLRVAVGKAYESAVLSFSEALGREGDLLDQPGKVLSHRHRKELASALGDAQRWEVHLWSIVAYRNAIMNFLGGPLEFATFLEIEDA